jgi:hypothetical protein
MAINFANNVRTRLARVALAADNTLKVTLDTSGAYQAPFDPTPGKVFLRIIDRDNNPQRLEFISYAGVSLSGGIYTLTGVLRGLGGTTARNWRGGVILENYFDADTLNNLIIDNATEDTAGIVQLADVPETIAGLIDDKAVHPAGLAAKLADWLINTLNSSFVPLTRTVNSIALSSNITLTTGNITEHASNLYHTTARVLATALTGLSTSTAADITASDTVLGAFGKLQARLSQRGMPAGGTTGQVITKVDGTDYNASWQDASGGGGGGSTGKQTQYIDATAMADGSVKPIWTVSLGVYDFSASIEQDVIFRWAMPKSWDAGTLSFRVHYTRAAVASGGIAWGLKVASQSDADSGTLVYGSQVVVTDTPLSSSMDYFVTSESASLTVGNTPTKQDMLTFSLRRVVSDPADTTTALGRLLGIDIYYTTDAGNDA